MWMPTDSRKGEDDHCWMKAGCVVQIHQSHHIGSLELLQLHSISLALTLLDALFGWGRPVYTVVSIESKELLGWPIPIQVEFGSNRSWVDIVNGGKKTSCAFITKVIPSSWCSYLSTRAYHDNQHTPTWLCLPLGIFAIFEIQKILRVFGMWRKTYGMFMSFFLSLMYIEVRRDLFV